MFLSRAAVAACFVIALGAPAAAQDERALVDAAVAEALSRAEAAPRFALTQTIENMNSGARYVVRFDPTLPEFDPESPEASRWSILEPAEAELNEDALEVWNGVRQQNDADIDVMMEEPARLIPAELVAQGEAEGQALYAGRLTETMEINGEPPSRAMRRNLAVELAVDAQTSLISRYRLFAEQSFRPMMAARINEFDLAMTFDEAWSGGPIVLTSVEQQIAGSAFFNDFSEHMRVTYSDFSPIE